MKLYRKAAIRGLNPVMAAHPSDFLGESALVGVSADVLDNRIAEDDIECLIGEGQHAAIARDEIDGPRGAFEGRGEIEDGELRLDGSKLPNQGRTTDVENAGLIGNMKRTLKEAHALGAEMAEGFL